MTDVLYAGEWEITPNIEVSESYDDNVKLSREGSQQEDYITQVNPGFFIVGTGRQTRLALDYRMQNIFYQYNGENDSTYHNLNAESNSEFVRDRLFLDASVHYTQRNINNEDASSFDNASIGENRSDIVVYTIRPYLIYPFGKSSILKLEHSYQEVDNKSDELIDADTKTNTSSINLTSGPSFTDFRWQLSHQEQVTDYRERPDVEYRDSKLTSKYFFSDKIFLIAIVGQEKYNYEPLPGQEKPEGSYWEAGFGWTPTHRTRLEITQGEHYHGDTKSLDFSHRTRRSTWEASYSETVSTTSSFETEPDTVAIYNPETESFDEYTTESYSNIAGVTLNKVLTVSISKTTAKTTFRINYTNIKREYLGQPVDQENTDIRAEWEWQFASRTNLVLSSKISTATISTTQNETTFKRNEIRINHHHSKKASTYIAYDNDSQKTDIDGILYKRNIYKIGFEARF